ncbi:MAG: hypothetical protein ABIS09_06085 [Sphingomicrobium sp.]
MTDLSEPPAAVRLTCMFREAAEATEAVARVARVLNPNRPPHLAKVGRTR